MATKVAAQLALCRRLETRAEDLAREVARQQLEVRELHAALVAANTKPITEVRGRPALSVPPYSG